MWFNFLIISCFTLSFYVNFVYQKKENHEPFFREGLGQRPKGLSQQTFVQIVSLFNSPSSPSWKNSQVNFIVQLSTFLIQSTDYGLITKPLLSLVGLITKPILSLIMLIWYGCGTCSCPFFSPSSCVDACCIGKVPWISLVMLSKSL